MFGGTEGRRIKKTRCLYAGQGNHSPPPLGQRNREVATRIPGHYVVQTRLRLISRVRGKERRLTRLLVSTDDLMNCSIDFGGIA